MSKAWCCTFGIFKIPPAAVWVYKRGNTATCDGILHRPDSWSEIWFKSAMWAHEKHSKGSQSLTITQTLSRTTCCLNRKNSNLLNETKQKNLHLNTSIPWPVVSLHWGGGSNSSPTVLLWIQPVSFWITSSCPQSPRALGTSPVPHLRLSCASPPSSYALCTPAPRETFCLSSGYILVSQQ